jgi:hypothetical protein
MNYGMPSAILVIWVAASSAYAEDPFLGPDLTHQTSHLEASSITTGPRSSWEEWLRHGARDVTPTVQASPRKLESAAPTTSLASPAGLGPEFIGPREDTRVGRETSHADGN